MLICCVSKSDGKKTSLSRAERATTRNSHGSAAEVLKISRSEAQEEPPDQRNYTVRNPLLNGEPVAHIQANPAYSWKHIQIWGCAQRVVRQSAGPGLYRHRNRTIGRPA